MASSSAEPAHAGGAGNVEADFKLTGAAGAVEAESSAENAAPVSKTLYNQAYNDYLQGRYSLSISEFGAFAAAYPKDKRAADCTYWIGECYYGMKNFAKAKTAFETMLKEQPESGRAPAAKLKLAFSHFALHETAQGIAVLKALIQDNPNSDEALMAKDRLDKIQD